MKCLHCHCRLFEINIHDHELPRMSRVIKVGKLFFCSLKHYRDFKGFGTN